MGEVLVYDRLDQLRKAVSDAPYKIKDGGKGVIVWETGPGAGWKEIATFLRREDAETFVFSMCWPVLGQWD